MPVRTCAFLTPTARACQAKRYEHDKRIIDILLWSAETCCLALLVVSGMSLWLRQWLESHASASLPILLTLYLLILGAADELLFFLFRWHRGYRLNRCYHLNVGSAWGWLWDYGKEKILSALLLLLVMQMLFWLMVHFPAAWWFMAALLLSLLMIILTHLAPLLLFPLFYRFRKLDNADLSHRLSTLALRAGVPLDRIVVAELSRKTRAANAGLAGLGRTRRIILSDTLLHHYSPDEIEAVIAHELGHCAGKHLWIRIALQSLTLFLVLGFIHYALAVFSPYLGYRLPADVAAIPLMALVSTVAVLLFFPPTNTLLRAFERRADSFAIQLTSKPWAMISTLERLARQNLADPNPNRLIEILFHSHPSLGRRIRWCKKWAEAHHLPTTRSLDEEPPADDGKSHSDSEKPPI